jgi:hypothetical protein
MKTGKEGDPIVFELLKGKMTEVRPPRNPELRSFVIVCVHGDWSGLRTLEDCKAEFPLLEARNREDGFYWVEER